MSHPDPTRTLCFGEFELDVDAYELRHLGKPVRLERRPMDLLILLIERRGQMVSRKEIVDRLWGPTVFVDVETGVNTAIRKVRQALQDSPDSPVCIETISGKGYRFIAAIKPTSSDRSSQPSGQSRMMLAVLPFENLSSQPEQDYFVDGLTEETISYLGRMNPERMGVIARTTSMAYKHTRKSIREIGAELGVDYVLESSVRREERRVRITSQLIRVADQTHIWASTYDRELTGVLAIQSELGTAIADHVRLQLSPERRDALSHSQTSNTEAYDLYLKGRYFWNQLSPPTTRRAIECYRRATEVDPNYALAWSGLADAYATSPINGDAPPSEIWSKASEAAKRAVELAPNLAETQTSLGFVKFWLDWEWTASETAFRKAIEINPSYSLAHRMLGIVLSHELKRTESVSAARQARQLDPLNATHHALSSQIAFAARDYDAAVQLAKHAITIDPEFWIGHMQLGQAYEQLGETDSALDALNVAGRLSGGNSKAIALRGYILARLSRGEDARELLKTLKAASREKYIPPYAFALIHAGLGEQREALGFLHRAVEVHDVHLTFLVYDPKWDSWRANSAFAEILAQCNFHSNL